MSENRLLDGLTFASNPLAYLLVNQGRLPSFLGGGNAIDSVGGAVRPVFNAMSNWFTPAYRGPMSRSGGAGWSPPSGGSGGYSPFNPAYSQAARAASPVGRSMASNRETFRQLNPSAGYVGAAHRNGNNGRLLGMGIIPWRQSGITFNDRQQDL